MANGEVPVLSLQELELRYKNLQAALERERLQAIAHDKEALKAKYAKLQQILDQGLAAILRMYEARRNWLGRVVSGQEPEPHGGQQSVIDELRAVIAQIGQHAARRSEMLGQLVASYGEEDMRTPARNPTAPPWGDTGSFAASTGSFGYPAQPPPSAPHPGFPNGPGHPSPNGYHTGSFPAGSGPMYPVESDYPTAAGPGGFQDPATTAMRGGRLVPASGLPGQKARVPQGWPPGHPNAPRGNAPVVRRTQGAPAQVRPGQIYQPGQAPPAVRRPGRRRRGRMQFLVVVGLVIAVLALVMTTVSRGSSGYPANVNQVKQWIAAACQNKNNTAWPGNVQFACSDQGRNMLWAFSLMTADANANYTGKQPGAQQRNGLMPVPAALGEQYALALNALRKGTMPDPTTLANQYAQARRLHQMYNQNDPVLSLQVAALILNTDVGGTVAFGYVQQGLMGDPQNGPSNCTRYTGSAEQTTLSSGLTICKQDLTPQGQEALVEDLLGKWVVPGSSRADQQEAATAAQAAAVLYRSPDKPDADAQRAMDWIAAEHKAGKLLV